MFYKNIILSIFGLLLFVLIFLIVILGVISFIELIVQTIIKVMYNLVISSIWYNGRCLLSIYIANRRFATFLWNSVNLSFYK